MSFTDKKKKATVKVKIPRKEESSRKLTLKKKTRDRSKRAHRRETTYSKKSLSTPFLSISNFLPPSLFLSPAGGEIRHSLAEIVIYIGRGDR